MRGGSRPSTSSVITLRPITDRRIRALFTLACVGNHPAEPWIDCMRRMVRLVEAEMQGQVYAAAHKREQDADYRRRQSVGAHRG